MPIDATKVMETDIKGVQRQKYPETHVDAVNGLDDYLLKKIINYNSLLGIDGKKIITVKKDGTGDFTKLRDAISSADKGTTIRIYPGVYNLTEEYSSSEINRSTFEGFLKDQDVSWEGIGPRGSIVLSADLTGYSASTIIRVSTIHIKASGEITNIKSIGKSVRYAMHDDDGWANTKKKYSNCDFKKLGTSGGYAQSVGGGTSSGSEHIYENCTFDTDWNDIPVSYHNNPNFSRPSRVDLINCKYSTTFTYQVRFGSMGSGEKDEVNLIGNQLSKVLVKEERDNGVGLDFYIRGRENGNFVIDAYSKEGITPKVMFSEDVRVNVIKQGG